MAGHVDSQSISNSLGHACVSHTELTSSRDWSAFLCPVRTKPSPCPCLDRSGPAQPIPGGPMEQIQLALPNPAPRDCVGALTMQSIIFFLFSSPSNVLGQCAHCQHMQLLIMGSRALQLQQGQPHYSWDEELGSSAVLAFSPLWPLLLLPLFVSFARKA